MMFTHFLRAGGLWTPRSVFAVPEEYTKILFLWDTTSGTNSYSWIHVCVSYECPTFFCVKVHFGS